MGVRRNEVQVFEAERWVDTRRATAEARLRQLEERLARLRAGEPSTSEDLKRAQAAARQQRVDWARSYQRMLRAHEVAITRHWSAIKTSRSVDSRPSVPTAGRGEQDRRLLHALMALTTQGSLQNDSVDETRREHLWAAVVDQSRKRGWRSWSRAVCRVAATELDRVRGAAISSYTNAGNPQPIAASDPWARRAEELQQVLGEGPGLNASRNGVPVLMTSAQTADKRWPGYGSALAAGVQGIWALPLQDGAVNASTLTCYLIDDSPPDRADWNDGWILTSIATAAVRIEADAIERGDDDDLEGYGEVGMAAGILSERLKMDPAEAMARMRAHAFANDADLAEVARAVIVDGSKL